MEKQVQRGRPRRTWVKLDCYGTLHGSINWQLTLEEQAIWIKSFAYSAVCGGKPGIIQDNDGKALPHWYIANELHCPLEVFESTLEKCIAANRMSENEHGIDIINFAAYQFTEYDRQKPYRDKKKDDLDKKQQGDDPDKYVKGKYGHMVQR